MDEPRCHGQPLTIAGRQQTAFGLRIQIEALQHGIHPLGKLTTVQAIGRPIERQVLAHGQRGIERELLRHVADAGPRPCRRHPQVRTRHLQRATGGRQQSAQHSERGGLSRPVGPQQAEDLAPQHLERGTGHRREVTEAAHQIAHDDDGFSIGFHCGRGRRLIIPAPLQGSIRSGRRRLFRRRLPDDRLCVLAQHQHEGIFQLGRSGMHLHVLQQRPQCRFINIRPTDEAYLSTAGHSVHHGRRCVQQPRLQHARRHAARRRRHEGEALRPLRQCLRRTVGQYVTGVHHVNMRTAFGLIHVGGAHHHAQLLVPHQLQQDLPQITAR